jgi:hypothetical protein
MSVFQGGSGIINAWRRDCLRHEPPRSVKKKTMTNNDTRMSKITIKNIKLIIKVIATVATALLGALGATYV